MKIRYIIEDKSTNLYFRFSDKIRAEKVAKALELQVVEIQEDDIPTWEGQYKLFRAMLS